MSKITIVAKDGRRGIWMSFDNGYEISIQFGSGMYCDNKEASENLYSVDMHEIDKVVPFESSTVEIAIIDPFKRLVSFDGDTVLGYVPAEDIGKWIEYARNLKGNTDEQIL